MKDYPNGTLLCSHKCVQPKPEVEIASDAGETCSFKETNLVSPLTSFLFSNEGATTLDFCIIEPFVWLLYLPATSESPKNGLIGDEGEEFRESTEGGDVNEAGARIVIVRSSDVKFEAWSVRTWNSNNSGKCQQTVDSKKSSSD